MAVAGSNFKEIFIFFGGEGFVIVLAFQSTDWKRPPTQSPGVCLADEAGFLAFHVSNEK